jgi:uncharacterized protein (TIGR03118 family)
MDIYDGIAAADAAIGVFVLLVLLAVLVAIFRWSNGGKKSCGTESRKAIGCSCNPKLRRTDRALVSNIPGQAASVDTGAVNSFGIAQDRDRPSDRPADRFWIAQNGAGILSLYESNGGLVETVIVPPAAGGDIGSPDGVAVAGSGQSSFFFTDGVSTGPAQVVTVTDDGTIAAYNPAVDPINAVTVLDASTLQKTFKGCCFVGNELYVAEFQQGAVEVYASDFSLVRSFTDPGLVAAGFAPHNVARLHGGLLAVAFAAQDISRTSAVPGVGAGYIDIFRASDGGLIQRLVNQGPLNAPYGMATDGCALLVSNHGDGRINAFDRRTGAFLGPLVDPHRNPISIDGIYGITNQLPRRPSKTCCPQDLMYAAGPNGGANGLFGRLRPR